jgi:hypothetical protein
VVVLVEVVEVVVLVEVVVGKRVVIEVRASGWWSYWLSW